MLGKDEIVHLLVSIITISIAFSVYRWGSFPVILLTVGTGFVLHEMGHKFVAQKFGCTAFYRAWLPGLAFALGLALLTAGKFVFAAPGAVYIGGKHITMRENGIIAAAGPLVNIILGFLFFLLIGSSDVIVHYVASFGAFVNFFLALFNMLPIPPLDGSKVIQWNVGIWGAMIAVSAFFIYGVF